MKPPVANPAYYGPAAIDTIGFDRCIGCGLCAYVCPFAAITMTKDDEGFEAPKVNTEKCKECGICTKLCPVASPESRNNREPEVFAAWSLRDKVRLASSSGGLFTEIAETALKHDNVVYGAAFNSSFELTHKCASSVHDLVTMRGSKYLPSRISPIYQDVLSTARKGKQILFFGTPCQCAAIEKLAKNEGMRHKVTLVDIVCHGVPSPVVFDAYLANQKLKRTDLAGISFRDKRLGWTRPSMHITTQEGREVSYQLRDDLFYQAFHRDLCLRDSCYDCSFSCVPRVGDLTLGDFWGCPEEIADEKGVSVVIVNTDAGRALLEEIRPRIALHVSDLPTAVQKNPRIVNGLWPSRPDKKHFMSALKRKGFRRAIKPFLARPQRPWVLRIAKGVLKGILGRLEKIVVPFVILLLRRFRFLPPRKGSVLVLPSTPFSGGLGDATALESISVSFPLCSYSRVDLLSYGPQKSHINPCPGYDHNVQPPTNLLWPRIGSSFRLALLFSRYDAFCVWGADCIDGVYGEAVSLAMMRVLALASALGLDTRILGFSWSKGALPSISSEIQRLSSIKFCVRDGGSRQRFEAETGCHATEVADVAFLFEASNPSLLVNPVLTWLSEQRQSSDVILALNLSCFALDVHTRAEAGVKVETLADALQEVKAAIPELKVLPFPHDIRDHPDQVGDQDLAELLRKALEHRSFGSIPAFPGHFTPSDVDHLVKQCDAVVTGRMHLAIAALRNCVPVLCMPYQDKFEGMLKLFDLETSVLDSLSSLSQEELVAVLHDFLDTRDSLADHIRAELPKVKELAWINFLPPASNKVKE